MKAMARSPPAQRFTVAARRAVGKLGVAVSSRAVAARIVVLPAWERRRGGDGAA